MKWHCSQNCLELFVFYLALGLTRIKIALGGFPPYVAGCEDQFLGLMIVNERIVQDNCP